MAIDAQLRSICFDCADPVRVGRFWADVLGYSFEGDETGSAVNPHDGGPNFWFNLVAEPKQVKNRVHIDVNLRDRNDLQQLEEMGARVLRTDQEIPGETWFIMADPEGNEFCAFPPDA